MSSSTGKAANCGLALKSSMISVDNFMSTNMPSIFDVNCWPHSFCVVLSDRMGW